MKKNNLFFILVFSIASLTFTGCLGVSDGFLDVKHRLFKDTNTSYKKNIEFSIGTIGMTLASSISWFAVDDDEAEEVLRHISGVQIGVYELKGKDYNDKGIADKEKVVGIMEAKGWTYIVCNKSRHESTYIFVRVDKDTHFRDMFVITRDNNNLVLLAVHGKLDLLVEHAIREKDFKMERRYNY
jgi:hypothetical protein